MKRFIKVSVLPFKSNEREVAEILVNVDNIESINPAYSYPKGKLNEKTNSVIEFTGSNVRCLQSELTIDEFEKLLN